MLIRYFGAAKAAVGFNEETLPEASLTLGELLEKLAARHSDPPAGAPALKTVLARSTFLVNETAAQDRARVLSAHDVVDVLPPFAGG